MVALIQRVKQASVTVDGEITGQIAGGILILLGIHSDDTEQELHWLVKKCANLRIFDDADGVMNLSLLDTGAEALVVSQFTLYGNTQKGNRPSYMASARPETKAVRESCQTWRVNLRQQRIQVSPGTSRGCP